MKDLSDKALVWISVIMACLFFGAYFEVVTSILTIYLTICFAKQCKRRTFIQLDKTTVAVILLAILHLFVVPFAVDSGMAFVGFIKFMPLIPFVLVVSHLELQEREEIIHKLPDLGVLMTLISGGFMLIEPLSEYLNVSGRLSGSFQYPNTYALFLFMCIIIITYQEQIVNISLHTVRVIVLLSGILLSGSRTIAVLVLMYGVYLLITKKGGRTTKILLVVIAALVTLSVVYYLLVGGGNITRYLTTSLGASTFVGRILYAKDAIVPILIHPLGLGYLGYQYMQGEFQTGVYELMHVHNEFLQMFLDIGWLGGLLFLYIIYKSIRSPRLPSKFKTMLVFLSLALILDFHLQYISMYMILLLLLDYEPVSNEGYKEYKNHKYHSRKRKTKTKSLNMQKQSTVAYVPVRKYWVIAMATTIVMCNVYMGTALGLEYIGYKEMSLNIYPYNTRIYINNLLSSSDKDISIYNAQKILALNPNFPYANREIGAKKFTQGDIAGAVEYKLKEIQYAKYRVEGYQELLEMLEHAKILYMNADSAEGLAYCEDMIEHVEIIVTEVIQETSALAWLIDEKPELDLIH